MADKPEYQWWNPYGAFSDPINKATIDAQIKQEDEDFLKLLRKPEKGLKYYPQYNPFSEEALNNWEENTKKLSENHLKNRYNKESVGYGTYADEYGYHSGELYTPATKEQIAASERFNVYRPQFKWDGYEDNSNIDKGIIEKEKYWTSGKDTWNALFGNNGATIDSQNSEDKGPSEISMLSPKAIVATPEAPKKQEPEPYKVIPYKFDRITDVIERIETFANDQTPEERMKAKPGGSKKNPAIGPHHARAIFPKEVNRLNHDKKRNPNAPVYTWDDNKDYNKSREMINSFFEAIYPDLKEKLGGKEPTDEDYAISYNQGGVNWAHNPEEYRKLYRQNLVIDLESKAKKKKKEEEAAKKKAEAEAAAKTKK